MVNGLIHAQFTFPHDKIIFAEFFRIEGHRFDIGYARVRPGVDYTVLVSYFDEVYVVVEGGQYRKLYTPPPNEVQAKMNMTDGFIKILTYDEIIYLNNLQPVQRPPTP